MNAQEIFDKSFTHLLQQGRPGWTIESGCKYRTDDGAACGVGCLIDDETAAAWDARLNGSIRNVIHHGLLPEFLHGSEELLKDIQSAHDTIAGQIMEGDIAPKAFPTALRERWMEIATQFNLDTKVLA